jgi:hypothetical protein
MYTKLLVFSVSFTAITSYGMLPSHLLRRQLVHTIISHTTKPTPKPSPQLSIFEQAAQYQKELAAQKQLIQSEIPLSPEAQKAQELALAKIEDNQKQVAGAAWFLGLSEKKVRSNRRIAPKYPKSKPGKRV